MKYKTYTFTALVLATAFWVSDSVIHRLIYQEEGFEWLPSEPNELWMRVVIVVLLLIFGAYVDISTRKLLEKEQEKARIFAATVSSSEHILNNLINQMQYFKIVAEEQQAFDKETLKLYEEVREEGLRLLARLKSVDEVSEDRIYRAVHPDEERKI